MAEMTLEEWIELPEDAEGELVDGRLVEEEVPSFEHETVVAWLMVQLYLAIVPRGGFVFGSEAKYAVAARTGRKPDLAVYRPNPKPKSGGLARTPPDLVVEVISNRARDRRRDRIEKAAEYAAFGVKVYVLVDPEAESFEVFTLTRGRWVRSIARARGIVTLPGVDVELNLDELWTRVAEVRALSRTR
jgi:Uma2 family endonuclease